MLKLTGLMGKITDKYARINTWSVAGIVANKLEIGREGLPWDVVLLVHIVTPTGEI